MTYSKATDRRKSPVSLRLLLSVMKSILERDGISEWIGSERESKSDRPLRFCQPLVSGFITWLLPVLMAEVSEKSARRAQLTNFSFQNTLNIPL